MLWKDVNGYEGLYLVSENGDIYSFLSNKEKTWSYDKNGYPWVMLHGKEKPVKKFVHAIVLESFIGPRPENGVARHYPDYTPTNVHYTNLKWGTPGENARDRYYNLNTNNTKLTEEDVLSIKKQLLNGSTQADICRAYDLNRETVSKIVANETWKNVGPDLSSYNFDKRRVLTEEEVAQIKYLINRNYNGEVIRDNYKISTDVYYGIRDGKNYNHISEAKDLEFLQRIKNTQTRKAPTILSQEQREQLKKMKKQGFSIKQLIKKFNVSKSTVTKI